jgi:NAD-dependent SIR2 family protein deacetylase
MIDAIEHAAELFAAARRVVVVTGAGMSKESGIPTFRDAQTGLWSRYDPQELATRRGFANNPALVWTWYAERRAIIERAQPHDGYRALAQMEPHFDSLVILTQNIDGLHSAAGSCESSSCTETFGARNVSTPITPARGRIRPTTFHHAASADRSFAPTWCGSVKCSIRRISIGPPRRSMRAT